MDEMLTTDTDLGPPPTVEVSLDETRFTAKPDGESVKGISNAIARNRREITLEELANLLTQGCTFSPGVFRDNQRSNDTWVQQQLFALDFDHGLRIDGFLEMCVELEVHPAFVYPSFSHTEENQRFRAVFVNDAVVTDMRLRKFVQGLLMKLFSLPGTMGKEAADKACIDAARMFYGTDKPLTHADFDARINPIGLYDRYLKLRESNDRSHAAQHRKKLAEDLDIRMRTDDIGVFVCGNYYQSSENTVSAIEYIENTVNSQGFALVPFQDQVYKILWKTGSEPVSTRDGEIISTSQNTPNIVRARETVPQKGSKIRLSPEDKQLLTEKCRLVRDFMSGEVHIDHQGRRILVNNLRHREGGIAWYERGRALRSDYAPDTLVEDGKRYQWLPEDCSSCPYDPECSHKKNLLQQIPLRTRECRQIKDPPTREPLGTTRKRLGEELRRCMESSENGVFVIKCDTGVGKTWELLKQDLEGVCIALDTHRLKNEVHERLLAEVRERVLAEVDERVLAEVQSVFIWPDPPDLPEELQKQLNHRYLLGSGGTKAILERALEHDEVIRDTEWAGRIQDHLTAMREVHLANQVLTTHEKAFQLAGNPNIRTFVFDEDFVKTLIRLEEVRPQDIKTFRKQLRGSADERSAELLTHLKTVLKAPASTNHLNAHMEYSSALLRQTLLQMPSSFTSPIEALFRCHTFRKDRAGGSSPENIFCISGKPLREDRKYIILSATADEQVYRRLFGDRLKFINLPGTKLKGTLFCHTAKSFTKTQIMKDPAAFAATVQANMQEYGFDGVITHKFCAEARENGAFLKGSQGSVPVFGTFGGLQGLDSYGGRNIAIYGTPYPPEHVVKLWAALLGLEVDEESSDFPQKTFEMGEYEVSAAACCDDPEIQHLYLWLTHSQVIQAVGRARLVSHDCTVHVFGKLPVSGCLLIS